MKTPWKSILKNTLYGAKLTGIALLLAIVLRVFFFDSFKIPSYSMLPTLEAGDYILVNKLILGGRVYKNFDFMDGAKVETKRLWGIRDVRRNDVLVFNYPYKNNWDNMDFNLNTFYVKRCVAIPGDTFYIENGIYKVKNCSDTLGNYDNQVKSRDRFLRETDRPPDNCFPYHAEYRWTVLNFGPLYLPKKGDALPVDTCNYILYKNLIAYETDKPVEVRDGHVFLGDSAINRYTFKMNYYFMAGDYVFDSVDSRYWGLLPEDHIVGKVALIWKSEDMKTRKFRWKRFFKTIS